MAKANKRVLDRLSCLFKHRQHHHHHHHHHQQQQQQQQQHRSSKSSSSKKPKPGNRPVLVLFTSAAADPWPPIEIQPNLRRHPISSDSSSILFFVSSSRPRNVWRFSRTETPSSAKLGKRSAKLGKLRGEAVPYDFFVSISNDEDDATSSGRQRPASAKLGNQAAKLGKRSAKLGKLREKAVPFDFFCFHIKRWK